MMQPTLNTLAPAADIQAHFNLTREWVDTALDACIPAADVEPITLHEAIRWSLFAPGKRFRSALLLATGLTFGATREQLASTACALEMIHTYSLIHDDLPSMDDDELRRGRATCHVRFGEAQAILAGDALQALAYECITRDEALSANIRVEVLTEIACGAGTPSGMVAGQSLDLTAESHPITGPELERIHARKTGALIRAAARAGAIIAGAAPADLQQVDAYGTQLGLLFQITDDLLDVTATAAELGKTPGKDAKASKATYPALYGLEAAREQARQAHALAGAALLQIERPTPLLRGLADFILSRSS